MNIYKRALLDGIVRTITLPAVSLPLLTTLGLTLGALLTVVAIVSTLMLQPLPGVKDAAGLHTINIQIHISQEWSVPFFNWHRLDDFQKTFAERGQWGAVSVSESKVKNAQGETYPVTQYQVSNNILSLLGSQLIQGQAIDAVAPENHIWISNSLWQQLFSGRTAALGQTLSVDGSDYLVMGIIEDVMSIKAKHQPLPQQIWLITDMQQQLAKQDSDVLSGPLLNIIFRGNQAAVPSEAEVTDWFQDYCKRSIPPQLLGSISQFSPTAEIQPYRDNLNADSSELLKLLLVTAISLLLMASLNLLNLFSAHYQSRSQEFAIQKILGAGRVRLFLMLLLENIPSFLLATSIGLLLSAWTLQTLPLLGDDLFPLLSRFHIDAFTAMVACSVVMLLALLFSLLALLEVDRSDLAQAINSSGKGTNGQTNHSLRKTLMVLQLCIAAPLLTGSIMLAKQSFHAVYQPLGYRLADTYSLSWQYADESWATDLGEFDDNYANSAYYQLEQELMQLLTQQLPEAKVLAGEPPLSRTFFLRMLTHPDFPEGLLYQHRRLSYGAFSTYGIRLLAGNSPTLQQIQAGEKLIVIDKTLANRLYADIPLHQLPGRSLVIDQSQDAPAYQIVGVVENSLSIAGKLGDFDFPSIYRLPRSNDQRLNLAMVLPAGQRPDSAAIATEVAKRFPGLGKLELQSLDERWREFTHAQRTYLAVNITLSLLILLLAIIGIGGLTHISTKQQSYDLAIRMATGASQGRLLRLIVKDTSWMLILGLGLGFILSVSLYQQLALSIKMLPAFDWQSMLLIDLILALVVLLAVAVPGWRVLRANPMQTLREL